MITPEEYSLLLTDEVRRAIAAARGRDPLEVSLYRSVPHSRLVATQVKYLARAAQKLPSYAAAQCILPPLAFEQASSEACAAHKEPAGDTALDLTCGLGVDALALGRRFRRVVALERDPVLAAVAARNLRLLGAANVEVVCASDDDYAEAAPKVKELLAGKAILVVAGAPACAPELEAQGITNFISVKSNVLETLKFYLKEMGI